MSLISHHSAALAVGIVLAAPIPAVYAEAARTALTIYSSAQPGAIPADSPTWTWWPSVRPGP